jgi:hypothetical protein
MRDRLTPQLDVDIYEKPNRPSPKLELLPLESNSLHPEVDQEYHILDKVHSAEGLVVLLRTSRSWASASTDEKIEVKVSARDHPLVRILYRVWTEEGTLRFTKLNE